MAEGEWLRTTAGGLRTAAFESLRNLQSTVSDRP